MKLKIYLTESKEYLDWKEIKQVIKLDCQPFLKEKVILYRGGGYFGDGMIYKKLRTDRIPTDLPRKLHDAFDNVTNKKYGFKARSESVFATPNIVTANRYDKPNLIFPKGDFKYIWSPDIKDLFYSWLHSFKKDVKFLHDKELDEYFEDFIDMFYQPYGLKDIKKYDVEVMIHCPMGYYLVNTDYEQQIRKEFNIK